MNHELERDRLHPNVEHLWESQGNLSQYLKLLGNIDNAQQLSQLNQLSLAYAVSTIKQNLSQVFDLMKDSVRQLEVNLVQRDLGLNPTIGQDLHSLPANELLVPAVTYIPGPTDFIFVAYSETFGAVITFEEGRTAEKIIPAVEQVLKKGLEINLVNAMFGKKQLAITDWYEKPTFNASISEAVRQSVQQLELLNQNKHSKPDQIYCYASGLEGFSPEYYQDFSNLATKAINEALPTEWNSINDFSRIGENFGWIYGGSDHLEYPVPTPYDLNTKS